MTSETRPATSRPPTDVAPFRVLTRALAALRARRALRAARRAADEELLHSPVPTLRLAWRAAELVTPKRRHELAKSLRSLVRNADPRYLPSAQIFNRRAVRASSDELLAAADRLVELERPVTARGVLLLERLLVDTDGPLYDRERGNELPERVRTAAAALELP
jgi:hypothetical protein